MEMRPKSRSAVGTRESQMTGHDRSVFRDVLVTRNAYTRLGRVTQATETRRF
jgi:hypothetical protein